MNKIENPVLSFRHEKNWSRSELCQHCGLVYNSVVNAERGHTRHLSPTILAALAKLGLDPAVVEQNYQEWLLACQEDTHNE